MEIVRTCTKYIFIFSMLVSGALPIGTVYAQDAVALQGEASAPAPEIIPPEYVLGKVIGILEEGTDGMAGFEDAYQRVLVEIISGSEQGRVVTIDYRSSSIGFDPFRLHENDPVILAETKDARGAVYYILDRFRLPVVFLAACVFAALAIALGRWRGIMSLVGLGVSLIVLVGFVVPHIMAGESPLLISIMGTCMIAVSSLFLAHGFTKRTLLAFIATIFVLMLAFAFAYATVLWSMLSGASSEEAVFLQAGFLQNIDLRGLLLGGLVIGALGVLDDVTTAQVAAVEEISRANRTLDMGELYRRGIAVGREHIASLVNTLALAYVGASFPLFLLFSLPENPPLWVILNGESIVVEMLRAIIGGSALMLAVPVSTALAAWAFGKGLIKITDHGHGGHRH